MARIQTRPWDAADYLKTQEDIVAYLEAVLEDGDPRLIAAALADVVRSKGFTKIATEAGLEGQNLSRALSPDGNTSLATVLKVIQALDLRLYRSVAHEADPPRVTAEDLWNSAYTPTTIDYGVKIFEHEPFSVSHTSEYR